MPLHGPSSRPPLTLQDDLFERLPLQPVPAPQLLRDVALPAGEVGGAEGRRHGARCPAPQRRGSERGLAAAARSMRRPAGAGRRAGAPLTYSSRPPPPPPGTVFRLLSEMVLARAGRPASSPTSYPTRTQVIGAGAWRSLMTPSRGRKRCGDRGGRWEALGLHGSWAVVGKEAGKRPHPPAAYVSFAS